MSLGVRWKRSMSGCLRQLLFLFLAIIIIIFMIISVFWMGFLFVGFIIWGWWGLLCVSVVLAIVWWVILLNVISPDTVERYPDGRPKARGEHYHGDKQGIWTFWYASGQKESRGEFIGGWESGIWTFWHPNGQMKSRGEIGDDGLKSGPWEYWDTEGHELTEDEYLARYSRSDREPSARTKRHLSNLSFGDLD
jgi:hypothetical protein